MNPLLENHPLPPFSKIHPEHIEPALDQLLAESRAKLQAILEQGEFTWETLMTPLEVLDDRLHKLWSPVSHMHSVVDSEALRAAYHACLPKITEYSTELSQNEDLYRAIKALKDSSAFEAFSKAQKKTLENALRDFRLSGIGLNPAKKATYAKLAQAASKQASQFSENVLDATQAWTYLVTDISELAGMPEHALQSAKQAAELKNQQGYLLTLEVPCYIAVMQNADNRELRQKLYEAYVTRASNLGLNKSEFDNSELMVDILKTKHAIANLLDFENYADYSLATKMAASSEEVLTFLHDLAKKSKPLAEKEMATLKAFALKEFNITEFSPWDVPYYSEKLKRAAYDISQDQLRPYFPEDKVLKGLFALVKKLYGMTVLEVKGVDAWHQDVRFFEVFDEANELRGYFYLDLYVREHKRGGAWMDDCQIRRLDGDEVQPPIAYVVCNFAKPIGDQPALFTHDDVVTLFHEFGHCLHHILTKVDYPEVSGINGVEWDAVELPSQFMENWCWQQSVLNEISGHFESGEPLPEDMLKRLLKAKNFHSGMQMMRQLEFALFDFILHKEFKDSNTVNDIQKTLDTVRKEVAVVPAASFNRFQNSFTHVFGGGYAAGYYSYKWAEVLSSDAFAKFEENDYLEGNAGQDFLAHILEKGGSESMSVLYENFRGRAPSVDALLRHSGILEE